MASRRGEDLPAQFSQSRSQKASELTKKKHVVHHFLLGKRLDSDEFQGIIGQKHTGAEVGLFMLCLVLWHKSIYVHSTCL